MTSRPLNVSPPFVSVLLPVYNGMPYLSVAVNSLLSQTWVDYELIIVNDGSSDGSAAYLDSLHDHRVRVIHQDNRGLAGALNVAIGYARGRYLARQDQDDISRPDRLALQVAFLNAHPAVSLVGGAARILEGDQPTDRLLQHPCDDGDLRLNLLFDSYIVHSSVMMRRDAIQALGGYCEDRTRQPPEDYELWSRMMKGHKLANLPEVLIDYRETPGSMSRSGPHPFRSKLVMLCAENIAWASGRSVQAPEVQALARLLHADPGWRQTRAIQPALHLLLDEALEGGTRVFGATAAQLQSAQRHRHAQLRWRHVDDLSGGRLGRLTRSSTGRWLFGAMRRITGRA